MFNQHIINLKFYIQIQCLMVVSKINRIMENLQLLSSVEYVNDIKVKQIITGIKKYHSIARVFNTGKLIKLQTTPKQIKQLL